MTFRIQGQSTQIQSVVQTRFQTCLGVLKITTRSSLRILLKVTALEMEEPPATSIICGCSITCPRMSQVAL